MNDVLERHVVEGEKLEQKREGKCEIGTLKPTISPPLSKCKSLEYLVAQVFQNNKNRLQAFYALAGALDDLLQSVSPISLLY